MNNIYIYNSSTSICWVHIPLYIEPFIHGIPHDLHWHFTAPGCLCLSAMMGRLSFMAAVNRSFSGVHGSETKQILVGCHEAHWGPDHKTLEGDRVTKMVIFQQKNDDFTKKDVGIYPTGDWKNQETWWFVGQQQRGQLAAVVVMYQRKMGLESTLMGWRFKPTETKPTQLEIFPGRKWHWGKKYMKFWPTHILI